MTILNFKGFGGVRLEAEAIGDENDPTILLVHGAGQTRAEWQTVADALVQAGRRVVSLDLRGHGGSEWPESGRYDLEAHIEDLRAVLALFEEAGFRLTGVQDIAPALVPGAGRITALSGQGQGRIVGSGG